MRFRGKECGIRGKAQRWQEISWRRGDRWRCWRERPVLSPCAPLDLVFIAFLLVLIHHTELPPAFIFSVGVRHTVIWVIDLFFFFFEARSWGTFHLGFVLGLLVSLPRVPRIRDGWVVHRWPFLRLFGELPDVCAGSISGRVFCLLLSNLRSDLVGGGVVARSGI